MALWFSRRFMALNKLIKDDTAETKAQKMKSGLRCSKSKRSDFEIVQVTSEFPESAPLIGSLDFPARTERSKARSSDPSKRASNLYNVYSSRRPANQLWLNEDRSSTSGSEFQRTFEGAPCARRLTGSAPKSCFSRPNRQGAKLLELHAWRCL